MTFQTSIEMPRSPEVDLAIRLLAESETHSDHGAVFTRAEIVEAILDLSGYRPEKRLFDKRLLEPSFGSGEFLLAAVHRLLNAYEEHGPGIQASELEHCILGVEIHKPTFLSTRRALLDLLQERGVDQVAAHRLVSRWLANDDFLFADIAGNFDFIVGNPPYIRQERIPNSLLEEYRLRFSTFYDRADLYVAFFEHGLNLLDEGGVLSFICSNRWMKNKYGGPLRAMVAKDFNLKYFIDTEQADAFHDQVHAYSAITVIEKADSRTTKLALATRSDSSRVTHVVNEMLGPSDPTQESRLIASVTGIARGRDPWLIDSPEVLHIVRSLESSFPKLEDADIRVGIGVATGCDRVFIGDYDKIPVEEERKLPLLLAKDIDSTTTSWNGRGLLNPYEADGSLADLKRYPRFAEYIWSHEETLRRRHVARKQPKSWYKTIDRVYPSLVSKEKLLIPDIKGHAMVSLDEGNTYPHHNLYVVTSDSWPLRPLQAVLRSSIALMFVAAYCTRMSGGFLRFQAQYLRRIRIPTWDSVSRKMRHRLGNLAESGDQEEIDIAASDLFGLGLSDHRQVSLFADESRVSTGK